MLYNIKITYMLHSCKLFIYFNKMALILICHYLLFLYELILLAANSSFKFRSLNKKLTAQIERSKQKRRPNVCSVR